MSESFSREVIRNCTCLVQFQYPEFLGEFNMFMCVDQWEEMLSSGGRGWEPLGEGVRTGDDSRSRVGIVYKVLPMLRKF